MPILRVDIPVVFASTPDYKGSMEDGFAAAGGEHVAVPAGSGGTLIPSKSPCWPVRPMVLGMWKS